MLLQLLVNQRPLSSGDVDQGVNLLFRGLLQGGGGLLPVIDQAVSRVDVLRKQFLTYVTFAQHSRIIGRSYSSRKVQ